MGAVVGGLFLSFETDFSHLMSHLVSGGAHLTRLFYGALMIFMAFVAPQGIVGEITKRVKSGVFSKPSRGRAYFLPTADYDFLNMKSSPIKKD